MSNYGWRPHIESALRLRLADLFKYRAVRAGCTTWGSWQWTRDGKPYASMGYRATLGATDGELRLRYRCGDEARDVECVVRLSSVPLNYGGRRWYMHCPLTGRRALILYKWSGIDRFCAREAIRPRPTYVSQRRGGCDRIIEQRWAIRRRLGDTYSDLFGEPIKPKGMRWRTFERHSARDAQLAAAEFGYFARLLGRGMRLQSAR
jgi:hypothetical protein